MFQGARWWLLIEHDAIGQRVALLEALPLDELHVFPLEQRLGRSLAAHCDALARWEVLIRYGGSLHTGGELSAQLALCQAADPQAVAMGWERLRLRCCPAVMAAVRRELDRYPPQSIRLSKPLPGDSWGRPDSPRTTMRLSRYSSCQGLRASSTSQMARLRASVVARVNTSTRVESFLLG